MSKALRPKSAVPCLYGFTNTQFTKEDRAMVEDYKRPILELMEKALECVEEFTEMQVVICKGNETITISNVDKVIRNLPKV